MAVHDVDAAFPLLPLSPILWPYFLFVWSPLPEDDTGGENEGGEEMDSLARVWRFRCQGSSRYIQDLLLGRGHWNG